MEKWPYKFDGGQEFYMKSGKYITGSDALAFVKEEMLHIFKSSAVLAEEKENNRNPVNVKNTNRPRRAFPVTNSYFGARKALLGRFV